MKKRLISFGTPLDAWLVREARRIGINVSELIRRILDKAREEAFRP